MVRGFPARINEGKYLSTKHLESLLLKFLAQRNYAMLKFGQSEKIKKSHDFIPLIGSHYFLRSVTMIRIFLVSFSPLVFLIVLLRKWQSCQSCLKQKVNTILNSKVLGQQDLSDIDFLFNSTQLIAENHALC